MPKGFFSPFSQNPFQKTFLEFPFSKSPFFFEKRENLQKNLCTINQRIQYIFFCNKKGKKYKIFSNVSCKKNMPKGFFSPFSQNPFQKNIFRISFSFFFSFFERIKSIFQIPQKSISYSFLDILLISGYLYWWGELISGYLYWWGELDVFPYQGNISCSIHRNHYPIPLIDSPLSILSKMLQYSYS